MAKPKFTKQQIEEALRATHGQVVLAARRLGARYETLLRYLKRYPDLDALRQELRTSIGEQVELKLVEKALQGEPWAVQFLLKSWMREIYGERVAVHHSAEPLKLELKLSDADRRTLYEILQRATGVYTGRLRLPE